MNQRLWMLLSASALGAAVALGACGGDSLPSDTSTATSTGDATTATSGAATSSSSGGMGGAGGGATTSAGATGTGGAGGSAPDCYSNPMTHVEIINACTTADKIDKMSTLPLLGPNGELPPLP